MKGKKFMSKNFKDLLVDIHKRPSEDQRKILNKNLETWKGDLEQTDDILVIGIKV